MIIAVIIALLGLGAILVAPIVAARLNAPAVPQTGGRSNQCEPAMNAPSPGR